MDSESRIFFYPITWGRDGLTRGFGISVVGDEIAREGLKRLLSELGFDVLTWPLTRFRTHLPDIVKARHQLLLVDAGTAAEGIAVAKVIRKSSASVDVVLICDKIPGVSIARQADRAAARLVPRSTSLVRLVEQVVDIASKHAMLEAEEGFEPDPNAGDQPGLEDELWKRMSTREMEILFRLANGDSNKVIARLFDLSEATVKVHVKAILKKLRLLNRTQAAIWAIRNGFEEEFDQRQAPAAALISTPHGSRTTSPN